MQCYYYGEPSRKFLKALYAIKTKAPWTKYPLVGALLLVWLLVIPLAWLAIKVGDAGHALAGWYGFDSREW